MPSTPNPGPGNNWPDAPETNPVPPDDRPAEADGAPARNGQAQAPYYPPPYPPANSGWNMPERRRKTIEELKATALQTRSRLRLFMIMVLGLMIVAQLELPFRLGGIPLGLAAGWVGIKVVIGLAEMRRAGLGSRGIIFTLFGLGMTGYLMLILVAHAVYYPAVSDLEQCQARANTESAQQICTDDYNERFDKILQDMRDRTQ
ncbi:hypothetical protein GCM10022223_36610 [Kineosporia mesophila]|uniref:DUF4190 domain-containing protein n=1 Tax=Kineosporia mesophila TaxID=566012 RepID=A0ABP6ZSG2_9ACTN|nr:hypothetical protein [Kineosporia mesophila]MCD5349912.1 hypothetical protein [Kineosporia mesophila]